MNCLEYARGCPNCQKFGPVQYVPAQELHFIVKLWLFKGWVMDLIGTII